MKLARAMATSALRDVARPLKKKRKDMKRMELAADDAEKSFDKVRKELKAKRNQIKKVAAEFTKSARVIVAEGRSADKMAVKLWSLFEAQLKKKVRDALSLKKEAGYELPLGQVDITIKNVEPELMREAVGQFGTDMFAGSRQLQANCGRGL